MLVIFGESFLVFLFKFGFEYINIFNSFEYLNTQVIQIYVSSKNSSLKFRQIPAGKRNGTCLDYSIKRSTNIWKAKPVRLL